MRRAAGLLMAAACVAVSAARAWRSRRMLGPAHRPRARRGRLAGPQADSCGVPATPPHATRPRRRSPCFRPGQFPVSLPAVSHLGARNDLPNPYGPGVHWGGCPTAARGDPRPAWPCGIDDTIWAIDRCGASGAGGGGCAESPLDPILQFDTTGKLLKSFGRGVMASPHKISVDRAGDIWVADSGQRAGQGPPGPQVQPQRHAGDVARQGRRRRNRRRASSTSRPTWPWLANGDIFVADGHVGGGGAVGQRAHRQVRPARAVPQDVRQEGHGAGRVRRAARAGVRLARPPVRRRPAEQPAADLRSADGKFIAQWFQFGRPSGLFIDRDDTLYVADSESRDGRTNTGQSDAGADRLRLQPGRASRHPHRQRAQRQTCRPSLPDPCPYPYPGGSRWPRAWQPTARGTSTARISWERCANCQTLGSSVSWSLAASLVAGSGTAVRRKAEPLRFLVSNGVKAALVAVAPGCEAQHRHEARRRLRHLHRPCGPCANRGALRRRVHDRGRHRRAGSRRGLDAESKTVGGEDPHRRGRARERRRTGHPHGRCACERRCSAASSVTYATDGASRPFIEKMFERLGIAAQMTAKTHPEQGSAASDGPRGRWPDRHGADAHQRDRAGAGFAVGRRVAQRVPGRGDVCGRRLGGQPAGPTARKVLECLVAPGAGSSSVESDWIARRTDPGQVTRVARQCKRRTAARKSLRVLFERVGQPSRQPADGEDRLARARREPDPVRQHRQCEIDVRPGQTLSRGDFQDRVGFRRGSEPASRQEIRHAGVTIGIERVSEARHSGIASQQLRLPLRRTLAPSNLPQHVFHLPAGGAMPRPAHGAKARDHRGVGIGLERGRHSHGQRRRCQFVVRHDDESSVDRAREA